MPSLLMTLSLAALLQTPAPTAKVAWVPNPRVATGTWVADPSHHLQPATIAELNGVIAGLEAQTGAEIAVVVVDSTSGLELFDFALAIHRAWGVGKRGANNGVVLLWVPAQRGLWISVGTGLEGAIPDRLAGRIRDQQIVAAFRRGEFDAGILAGVRSLADAARGEAAAVESRLPVDEDSRPSGLTSVWIVIKQELGRVLPGFLSKLLAFAVAVAAIIGSVTGIRRWRRRRPRPCPNGHGFMRLLDERSDDEKLVPGEKVEESLKSVDYDVWVCDTCGHTEKIAHKAWFTVYSECPECHRRTATHVDTVIRAATTMSTGRKRVKWQCGNCGWKQETEQTIPMLSTSSGGGSSGGSSGGGGGGGSSFGGGSASGGGAGGHY